MMLAQAPTSMILGFSDVIPVEAFWITYPFVCTHTKALEVYGTYPVDGVERCIQCVAPVKLWLPGLLEDPDALYATEYTMGRLLSDLRQEEQTQPGHRLRDIIEDFASVIDGLSDLRTESATYLYPEPDWEPRWDTND